MLGYLSAYKDKYKMCIISKDHLVTVELLDNKYDVAEICFNRIIFYPSEYSIVLTEVEVLDVQKLENYDVIEINSTGIYYRLFSDIERDTAIVTTSRCNSNCLMCPASDNSRSNAYDVPLENIKKLISYLPKNLYYLTVTGGEPTLIGIESFIEVMKSIKNKFNSTKVLLLTNGRTMGNIKFFKEFLNIIIPGMRVAIPIHRYDPQTHDKITQVHGSFNQSIRGIHHL
jgi:sulfatase maturation enzyme AslB (radical SAM superfamily)